MRRVNSTQALLADTSASQESNSTPDQSQIELFCSYVDEIAKMLQINARAHFKKIEKKYADIDLAPESCGEYQKDVNKMQTFLASITHACSETQAAMKAMSSKPSLENEKESEPEMLDIFKKHTLDCIKYIYQKHEMLLLAINKFDQRLSALIATSQPASTTNPQRIEETNTPGTQSKIDEPNAEPQDKMHSAKRVRLA